MLLLCRAGQKYDPHTDHCASVSLAAGRGRQLPARTAAAAHICPPDTFPAALARWQSPAAASTQSCQDFLRRGGGPKCGPGGGGVTCGDRLATFILYLRCGRQLWVGCAQPGCAASAGLIHTVSAKPWLPAAACRSPTRGGATVFPLAPSYRMHSLQPQHGGQALDQQPGGQAAQGAEQAQQGGEGTSAESGSSGDRSSGTSEEAGAADSRRLLRHGDGQLSGSAADTVPPYCQEGATALQVAPPSGSAVFFW